MPWTDWDAMIDRNDLNNGEMLSLLVMLLIGNLTMQDAPIDLLVALESAVMTRDPRMFLALCNVELNRDLPEHWRLAPSEVTR